MAPKQIAATGADKAPRGRAEGVEGGRKAEKAGKAEKAEKAKKAGDVKREAEGRRNVA